jgi:hypothetical protein
MGLAATAGCYYAHSEAGAGHDWLRTIRVWLVKDIQGQSWDLSSAEQLHEI